MDPFKQFKQTFIEECNELLADMQDKVIILDSGQTDSDLLNAIFRCAHSIKGGAATLGFEQVAHFTHSLESLLDLMRAGKMESSKEIIDVLLQSIDIIQEMIGSVSEDKAIPDGFGQSVLNHINLLVEGKSPTKEEGSIVSKEKDTGNSNQQKNFSIRFIPKIDLFASANEPLLIIRELKTLGNLQINLNIDAVPGIKEFDSANCYLSWSFTLETQANINRVKEVFEFVEDNCELTIEEISKVSEPAIKENIVKEEAAKPRLNQDHASHNNNANSIRIDIHKIDKLVNIVGELVITQSILALQTKNLNVKEFPELLKGIDELSLHSRELQEAVMSVRMQPVRSIFSRMQRLVRDLSSQLKKDIRLELFGEGTEIDKTLIEQLSDPLNHMIRNSADHGIETPEERVKKGKPTQGVIKLSAYHHGGKIIIEIEDDGAGINKEKVLKKAKEKNLIPENAVLSDEEIYRLLFLAGFSTADNVSDISGRGVGMDVVRSNIEALGGNIQIASELGKGSKFTLSLPLTLAILDGMLIRAANENYVLPIGNIIETIFLNPNDIRNVATKGEVINIRGEFIPIFSLGKVFSLSCRNADCNNSLAIIIECGKEKFGLVVDELLGQQQVVIKNMEISTSQIEGVSGATILGDGKVALILDVVKLRNLYTKCAQTDLASQICLI
jgi:two-component system chemotaxis sensor kinase CheA